MQENKDAGEIVWVVDKDDNEIGQATRQQIRDKNLIHRVTYIFLQNSENKWWVHKRTMSKAWCPGYFDIAFGGVLAYKETYRESAARELEEECGQKTELNEHFKIYFENENSKSWGMIYTSKSDGPLILQESEVESVLLMSIEEIEKRIEEKELFAPDSLKAFQILCESLKLQKL